MKKSGKGVENKIERKTIEKERRIRMKGLCFKLGTLIPGKGKEFLSHQDQIEEAATYIKILRERIEDLKRRKREAVTKRGASSINNAANLNRAESELPILRIKDFGSNFEVVVISGLVKKFMLHQIMRIVEDEGAQVVSVNLATVGDKILHTLHAQVKISRVGVDASRITERIHDLILKQ